MTANLYASSFPSPARAHSSSERQVSEFRSPEVIELDKQIMQLCIDLARFNISFHQSVNRKGLFQQWIYPMARECGTALSFSNTIIDLSQRARGLQNPDLISRDAQQSGVKCALIGQAVSGSASSTALARNLLQSFLASRSGYSPAKSAATVSSIVSRIDSLLTERRRLIDAQHLDDPDHVYALQGRLLDHLKNQLIYEFKTWSTRSRSTEWSENTFYALDSVQSFTQLASSCISLKAFNNPRLSGAAAISNLSANTIVTLNPIVRTLVGRFAASVEQRRLSRLFPKSRPHEIKEVLAEMGKDLTLSTKDDSATAEVKELAFLVRRSAELDAPLNKEVLKFEKLRRVADQQALSGPLIGLTGVTRGILNTTAFYATQNKSSGDSAESADAPSQNALFSNRLNFAGRTVQACGQAYSLVLTPTTEIRHFLYRRKLRSKGEAPDQQLQHRLVRLQQLETRVKETRF